VSLLSNVGLNSSDKVWRISLGILSVPYKDVKSFPGTRDPKIIPDPGKYISRTGIPVCVLLDVKNA
jgi:hypothetical protein